MSAKFTWGEAVTVCAEALETNKPVNNASICGIRKIETDEVSNKFSAEIGSYLYIVEFPDGESMELPEKYLSAVKR